MNRRGLLSGAAWLLGASQALAFGNLGYRGMFGLKNAGNKKITIPDTNVFPNDRYTSGPYLAFQSISDAISPRSQNMVINPASFPNATIFNWSWPVGADNSVKSWNAIDYGNYLQTVPPAQIIASHVSSVATLTEAHDFTYSAIADSANVALDFFLFTTPLSTTGSNMVCEIEVFFHTPNATKSFIDGLTNLGTYTSAIVGGTPSIVWKVGRQASNKYGKPYYLFYPSDQSDKPAATFDIKALLAWLSVPNSITTLTYLTGNEYYNGHAFGVEPLKNAGSLAVNSLSNSYTVTITNLVPAGARNDMTNAFWANDGGSTLFSAYFLETAANANHGMYTPTAIAKTAVVREYVISFDVDTAKGRTWCWMQVSTPDFGGTGSLTQFFDIGHGVLGSGSNSGSFTLYYGSIAPAGGGKYRCSVVMKAAVSGVGPQDIGVLVILRSSTGNNVQSFTGDITKGLNVSNAQFYQIS